MKPETGLTEKEQLIMDGLVKAWNEFAALDDHQGDDLRDFRKIIHEGQRILAVRAMRRHYPEFWGHS